MNLLMICFHTNGAIKDGFIQICNHLSKDTHVIVLTNKGISRKELPNCEVYIFDFIKSRFFSFFAPWKYHRLKTILRKIHYDYAFIYYFHPINLYLFLQINNSKLVVYVHDHIAHLGVPYLKRILINFQLKEVYKKAKAIVVSSNWMRRDMINRNLVSNNSRLFVNYLGLLENHLYPQNTYENIDVLFLGRIEYYKGLDILLESHKYLKNKDVRFMIVGRGDLLKTFHIQEIPSFVDIVNRYVSDEELALYIQRSKIIVLPYYEATGTQTIQTVFYYKKPIIATNVGCFPEYVTDMKDGIIVPARDPKALAQAIDILLNNEQLRIKMGKTGADKLKSIFSNELITKRYLKIFQNIK